MNPIEDLIKEHGSLKLMLRILEKINDKIINGESVAIGDLGNGMAFLKEFGDKCHHGKEEKFLFPMMKANNIDKEVELIDILLAEHDLGRGYIKNMAKAIEDKEKSPDKFMRFFLENSKKYIALLDQHIDKENSVLFPSARQSLAESHMKELETEFENLEKNVIGEGRHEELHGIIHQLKEIYIDASKKRS